VPHADGGAERWEAVEALLTDPARARLVLRIPPRTVAAFRLALAAGPRAVAAWSIAELNAYRDCR
jgi:hypothetical protein